MNRKELEERVVAITAQQAGLKDQYMQLDGHLGEIRHWLKKLDEIENPPPPPPEPPVPEGDLNDSKEPEADPEQTENSDGACIPEGETS